MSDYGDPLPRDVTCPTCGATGHPDVKPCQGLPTDSYHPSRVRAARDLLRKMEEVEARLQAERSPMKADTIMRGNRRARGNR
jgi:hypothetical protein